MARTFPYHQDNGYIFIEPMQYLLRGIHYRNRIEQFTPDLGLIFPRYLTCWVALNDTTVENGCPNFIPGLHRRGPLDHDFDEENGGWTIPRIRKFIIFNAKFIIFNTKSIILIEIEMKSTKKGTRILSAPRCRRGLSPVSGASHRI